MRRVFRIQGEGKVKDIGVRGLANHPEIDRLKAEVAAIPALIPLGLHAIQDLFQEEVTQLAGPRYARTGGQPGLVGWRAQGGSVDLLDQKRPVPLPRVRDRHRNPEVPLQSYQQLRAPRQADLGLYRKRFLGLSSLGNPPAVAGGSQRLTVPGRHESLLGREPLKAHGVPKRLPWTTP